MVESKFTQRVYDKFVNEFQEGWIDSLDWSDKEGKKALYKRSLSKIEAFRICVTEQYSMMALSGDHLLYETQCIDKLQNLIPVYVDEIAIKDKSLKSQLHNNFQTFLKDLNEVSLLAKNYIKIANDHFSMEEDVSTSYNLISYGCYRVERDEKVELLDLVFDVCLLEYDFSYDDDYIRSLLRYRRRLQDVSNNYQTTLRNIIKSCISKIELLLGKLSVFSKDRKIKYSFNFSPEIFKLDEPDSYPSNDYRNLYLKFLDPSLIDSKTIKEWSDESKNDNVKMWQLAFLMRYHVKCSKNSHSVEALKALTDHHHKDYYKNGEHNRVNDYSACSFINYMYNSWFSFKCQNIRGYTYKEMTEDLSKIQSLQQETSILNYHPYQKAIEFTLKWIEDKLKDGKNTEDLSDVVADLKAYFKTMKDNIKWCMLHQPYLMQLRYNFSCIQSEVEGLKMFCPSSICRPLQFHKLQEDVNKYAAKIAIVEYETNHQEDKEKLIEAKKKIEQMDRKNLEHLGLFTSVITFLVGLLSIFVGNNGNVSLTQRMEYIIALGLILVIFVCLGSFVIGSSLQKIKPWVFGLTLIGCLILLLQLLYGASSTNEKLYETHQIYNNDTLNVNVISEPIKEEYKCKTNVSQILKKSSQVEITNP